MTILKVVEEILWSEKRLTVIPLKFSVAKIKWTANRCTRIEDYVNLAFNTFSPFPFSIRPLQVKEEIIELLKILARRKPKLILEVGTARGGTLFLFARVSSPDAVIISIDLPSGYHELKVPLYKSFAIYNQKINLIRENSHDFSTLKIVKKILEGRKLEFLFIDGDHTYEGVKKDFKIYGSLVKEGGLVAFHDIVAHPPEAGCKVNMFWNEITYAYKCVEVVKDRGQKWAGIGIIYM